LVDIHIGAQWNARLYKDKVRFACDPRAATTKDVALNGASPIGIVYPSGYDRAAKMALVTTQSGKVLEIGCNGTNAYAKDSTVTLDQKYKSIHKAGNLVLGLTMDGQLREIQGNSSRPFSLGGLDGNIVEIAPNQSVAFFAEN
jgi:hypothetical protein